MSEVNEWRQVVVHQMLHDDPDFLSAAQILDRLRSSSYETTVDIKKSELSQLDVRRMLMSMVADGILCQRHGDKYGVLQDKFDIGAVAAEEQLKTHLTAKTAVDLISQYPGHFDNKSLKAKVITQCPIVPTESEWAIAIAEIKERNIAAQNNAGKWEIWESV